MVAVVVVDAGVEVEDDNKVVVVTEVGKAADDVVEEEPIVDVAAPCEHAATTMITRSPLKAGARDPPLRLSVGRTVRFLPSRRAGGNDWGVLGAFISVGPVLVCSSLMAFPCSYTSALAAPTHDHRGCRSRDHPPDAGPGGTAVTAGPELAEVGGYLSP